MIRSAATALEVPKRLAAKIGVLKLARKTGDVMRVDREVAGLSQGPSVPRLSFKLRGMAVSCLRILPLHDRTLY
jgi:hypothetical protein